MVDGPEVLARVERLARELTDAIPEAKALSTMAGRLVDGQQPLARTRLILAVLLGTLSRSRVYRTWTADSLRIAAADGGEVLLSVDGEAVETEPSLTVRKRPAGLLVYRPDGA